jgi:hypothetical protein
MSWSAPFTNNSNELSNKISDFAHIFNWSQEEKKLVNIFKKSHDLWIDNLKNIQQINYIMFCEAPPFDSFGCISNYIYNKDGEVRGTYLTAPYRALKGQLVKYPSKAEMINYLNSKGFLFIDILPLSINFSNKRNTKTYKKFLQYFWNGEGGNYNLNEFITQNRLKHLDFKIHNNVKVTFALKSVYNILNSLDNSNLNIGSKIISITNKNIVGVNGSNFPSWDKIKDSFLQNVVIK